MTALLTDTEVAQRLEDLDGWAQQGAQIQRTFKFGSFPAAIAFVTQVAFAAEAAGHHPDIDIRYRKVTLTLTTHDAGGLTDKDFALAARVEDLLG